MKVNVLVRVGKPAQGIVQGHNREVVGFRTIGNMGPTQFPPTTLVTEHSRILLAPQVIKRDRHMCSYVPKNHLINDSYTCNTRMYLAWAYICFQPCACTGADIKNCTLPPEINYRKLVLAATLYNNSWRLATAGAQTTKKNYLTCLTNSAGCHTSTCTCLAAVNYQMNWLGKRGRLRRDGSD